MRGSGGSEGAASGKQRSGDFRASIEGLKNDEAALRCCSESRISGGETRLGRDSCAQALFSSMSTRAAFPSIFLLSPALFAQFTELSRNDAVGNGEHTRFACIFRRPRRKPSRPRPSLKGASDLAPGSCPARAPARRVRSPFSLLPNWGFWSGKFRCNSVARQVAGVTSHAP